MLIDWFTVGAQIVNFLVLVWLLKRFLYRPVLDAIDQRERSIRDAIESAARTQADADQARTEFEQKNAALAREQESLLDRARKSAEAERLRSVESARTETAALRAKWMESLAAEARALRDDLTLKAQDEIIAIARQALRDFSGADLEERAASLFVKRLKELDLEERRRIALALKESGEAMVVRSAAPVAAAARQQIEAALTELFDPKASARFETNESLVSGFEVALGGYQLSWTLREYLDSLRKAAAEQIAANAKEVANGPAN
ncbi:MAG: F0F1 ATP synthase subunit B [Verrucomicrobiota bacterium]